MRKIILALASVALIGMSAHFERVFAFSGADGAVEYYLYSDGSDCEILSEKQMKDRLFESFSIKGCSIKGVEKDFVEKTLEKTGAVFVLEETVENRVSKYYYSNKIWGYKLINGQKVNLHVVIDNDDLSVGTPIIYGAY